jgi:ribonuclease BN (tRNA processing enzyme)
VKAVLLGSGGWIPTSTRETCCVLLRNGDDVLLLDAGTGIRRLLDRRELLEGARSVQIVLSHFHLDHVVGLGYLPALHLEKPPVLWGPGTALYGRPLRAILEQLLEPPFFAGLAAAASDVAELTEGDNVCGPFAVQTRVQRRHSEPTLAFRVGGLTYCSDTAADDGNVTFAAGCSTLLHEAWTACGGINDDIHTSARDAGAIAREAGAGRLVLVHVNPVADETELEPAAREEFANAVVGHDLLELDAR